VRFKRHLPLVALGLAFVAGAARAEDLLQVWAQARQADPLLRQAAAFSAAQAATAREARAALLPQWSLQASEQRENGDGGRTRSVTSSLSQPLFDLAALRTWDASRAQASAESARLAAAEQAARARVAEAYFGLLSAQAQLATARDNEEAFARQVSEADTRFKAGLSAQVEADQSRAYRELARSNTLAAELAVADAREALAQLTGTPPTRLQRLQPGPAGPTPARQRRGLGCACAAGQPGAARPGAGRGGE
jgi:outer membrane protein